MHIVVIVPTYNEAENLPKMVSALFALPLDLEVLIVDDASPDGSGQMAEELAYAHPGRMSVMHRTGKQGLATAYLQAFQRLFKTNVDAIVHMDCDFSHDPAVLVEMAKCIESSDLVIGSRYIPGGSTDVRWPIWRKALSAFGNYYARAILGLAIHDVTAGFRMWRREALQSMPLERVKATGYVFMVEMCYLADCSGLRISETPVYFAERCFGKSKMSFKIQVEAALRVWIVLWKYRDLREMKKIKNKKQKD